MKDIFSNVLKNAPHYLDVPFDKKDEAKKIKCRWDPDWKLWYYKDYKDKINFDEKLQKFINEYSIKFLWGTKFEDKDFIKSHGGKWCNDAKVWYVKYNNKEVIDYYNRNEK